MHNVCRAIDASEVFICDLTDLNLNVLFEFGYAVARGKIVWPLVDSTINDSDDRLQRLGLSGLVQVRYTQSEHIVDAFHRDRPLEADRDEKLFALFASHDGRGAGLLYLPSPIETEPSAALGRAISALSLPCTTACRMDSLSSYAENLGAAHCVIAHLLSNGRRDLNGHNAECSFVSGLAHGGGKRLLMLVQEPFDRPPVDYVELLKVHETAEEAEPQYTPWLAECEKEYRQRLSMQEIVDRAIRRALPDLVEGATPTAGQLARVTRLDFSGEEGFGDAGLRLLSGLTGLRILNLARTSVRHLGAISTLIDLEELVLAGTPVQSEELHLLAGLTRLRVLSLTDMRIDVCRLPELPELYELHLYHTDVTRPGIEHLGKMPKLNRLGLMKGQLPGDDLKLLRDLRPGIGVLWDSPTAAPDQGAREQPPRAVALREFTDGELVEQRAILDRAIRKKLGLPPNAPISDEERSNVTSLGLVDEDQFGDAGMSLLPGLPNLQLLNLGGTKVSDTGLAYVAGLTGLFYLNLHSTGISDAGLVHLSGLVNLDTLWLYNTAVSDAGLVHLEKLSKLRQLSLQDTDVTNAGVRALRKKLPNCAMGS
jgi:hypothetical protein